MHDASSKQATADALPSIIEYLAGEGYTFHRLDDIDYHAAPSTTAPVSVDNTDTDSSNSSASSADDNTYPTTTAATQSSAPEVPKTSQTPSTLAPVSTGTIVIQ